MTSMRFVTLNTWGTRGDWDVRLPVFREVFRTLGADIVTLQETILTDSSDQAADMLGSGYHLAQQRDREDDGQGITTASKWPFGRTLEVDFRLTGRAGVRDRGSGRGHGSGRTGDFACTCLVTEVLAPDPLGRIWVANHFPDYQLDHERERCLQSAAAARTLESLAAGSPGHVIVAGDMDADLSSDSMRFWTGRHVIEDTSVCYRSAWESAHPGEPLATYVPENPNQVNTDWAFRGIDHILIRYGPSGDPTLPIRACRRVFDQGSAIVSDHYGLLAEFGHPER
ncbi:MAG TPA: endonuclease/exonuclease/phosphatase family protein [Trebonia sp.]|jgi:endonuclease/exonuclease/phosphatase family metal-dependent hydrolase